MGTPAAELPARAESFATQPLGIVAAPGQVLTRTRDIARERLASHDFIVREPGSGTRAAMERFFRDARIEPPRVMETTSHEAIKQAVLAQMGLAFLSLHTAGLELRESMLIAVDVVGLPLMRGWYVVDMALGRRSDAAQALRRYILDHGQAAIAQQFDRVDLLWASAPARSSAASFDAGHA